jgi:threonylcarbamoyladenosine tRNA methylthiotransferase MtaB
MQSGSDDVLRRMKRRWSSDQFTRRCEEILSKFDRLALTTDVIVGFPGETEEQFEETCRLVERLRFSKVHIFRFISREGTEAATLPDRVLPSEQKRRATILSDIASKLRSDFASSFVGRRATVLLETETSGTCERYLDVRIEQAQEHGVLVPGQLVPVQIGSVEGDVCVVNGLIT